MPMSPRLLRPRQAGGFDPRSITGLAMWLDAADADTVTLNGSTVSEWRDKGPEGRHFVMGVAASQPAYSLLGENNRNSLTFDGSRRLISSQPSTAWSFLHDGTMVYAMYVVSRATGTTNIVRTIMSTGDSGRGTFRSFFLWHDFGQFVANNVRCEVIAPGGNGLICTRSLPGQTTGVRRAFEVYGDLLNADRASRVQLTNNSASASSATPGTSDPSSGSPQLNMAIGSLTTNQTLGLVGSLCEIIIVARPSQISTQERAAIMQYLVAKWGL